MPAVVVTTIRYPGRVCLLGEHCDWAGGASLAVPLPMGVTVRASAGEEDLVCRSELDDSILEGRWPQAGVVDPDGGPLRFVPAAASALTARGVDLLPTQLEVTADLPAGRGFSSSAAFTLAVVDALAQRAGVDCSPSELAELAFHVERDLLGVQCGRLDQLACVSRRPVFVRWEGGRPVEPRTVVPGCDVHVVVAAFFRLRDTAGILATLNAHHAGAGAEGNVLAVRRAVETWATEAVRGADALARGDLAVLGDAMNTAQRVYTGDLHVRFPALRADRLVETCAELTTSLGALGAKFSGAGGDGSVVALFADAASAARAFDALTTRSDVSAWHCPVEVRGHRAAHS